MAPALVIDHAPAASEELDYRLETYLVMLIETQPFHLEISAPAAKIYDELAVHWPVLQGWGDQAIDLLARIQELAQPLDEVGHDRHLRVSVFVASNPSLPPLDRHEPALLLSIDVMEGTVLHQHLAAGQDSHDPFFDHVELGLMLAVQPFDSKGDAQAIGYGLLPVSPNSHSHLSRKR